MTTKRVLYFSSVFPSRESFGRESPEPSWGGERKESELFFSKESEVLSEAVRGLKSKKEKKNVDNAFDEASFCLS